MTQPAGDCFSFHVTKLTYQTGTAMYFMVQLDIYIQYQCSRDEWFLHLPFVYRINRLISCIVESKNKTVPSHASKLYLSIFYTQKNVASIFTNYGALSLYSWLFSEMSTFSIFLMYIYKKMLACIPVNDIKFLLKRC